MKLEFKPEDFLLFDGSKVIPDIAVRQSVVTVA